MALKNDDDVLILEFMMMSCLFSINVKNLVPRYIFISLTYFQHPKLIFNLFNEFLYLLPLIGSLSSWFTAGYIFLTICTIDLMLMMSMYSSSSM